MASAMYNGEDGRCQMKRLLYGVSCVFLLYFFLQLEARIVPVLVSDYKLRDFNWNHIQDALQLLLFALAYTVAIKRLSEPVATLLAMLAPIFTIAIGIGVMLPTNS
jgi:drug/metabolite transporter (DMT)-like permease